MNILTKTYGFSLVKLLRIQFSQKILLSVTWLISAESGSVRDWELLEMPVLYQQNVRFKTAGIYHYKIVHGMRDSVLAGINDVGIRVEKVGSR